MSLDLLSTQKATMTVSLDDGAGHVTPLDLQFHYSVSNSVVGVQVVAGDVFVVAQSIGDAVIHLTTMDGSVTLDVPVSVASDPAAPVPTLVVTFGTPEPK